MTGSVPGRALTTIRSLCLLSASARRAARATGSIETTRPPAVVLVDPLSDLAQQALGLVPAGRQPDVVYLDVGYALRRPFGMNLLRSGLGWSRDQLVENALRVFRQEFDNFWGPRMELVFRMALLLLVDANERIVAADPTGGRDRQFTVLEVPRVLEDDRLRKFAANLTARAVVGQSRSTIDPLSWVRDGAFVIVNVAKEQVGADIAGMIGGPLINLLALAVGHQAGVQPASRRRVALLASQMYGYTASTGRVRKISLAHRHGIRHDYIVVAPARAGSVSGFSHRPEPTSFAGKPPLRWPAGCKDKETRTTTDRPSTGRSSLAGRRSGLPPPGYGVEQ